VDQEPVRATDFTALAGYYRSSVADLMRQIALLEDPDRRERAITHARLQIAEMNGRLRMLEDLDLIPRTTAAESRSEE
jgi:hypothetical protein